MYVDVDTQITAVLGFLPPFPHILRLERKVRQVWDIINTIGSCSSKKPQSTQTVGLDLVRTAKQPGHPRDGARC